MFLATLALGVHVATGSFAARALSLADRLATCAYAPAQGVFPTEDLWQSGNTLEALSTAVLLARAAPALAPGRAAQWAALLNNSYEKTPVIVDNCFDDHQWWLLGWARAFEATGVEAYLLRAAAVFEFIAANGWTPGFCGGGVNWCPVTGSEKPYKNAVTSELFLAAAMALQPHEAAIGKPAGYYLGWAQRVWAWLDASGMQNAQHLFNDGLNNAPDCTNNGGTTWTYNQGLAFSGLGRLTNVTGDAQFAGRAVQLMAAAAELLTTPAGILAEPCSTCDGDQQIFKGVWARHLAYLVAAAPAQAQPLAGAFLRAQALSLLENASCVGGGFGLLWQGPCSASRSTASDSAALDLLLAAAAAAPPAAMAWSSLGVGSCVDAAGETMPSCSAAGPSEAACRAAAVADPASVAYDFAQGCLGATLCSVRTLASSCAPGFTFSAGTGAKAVSAVDGKALVTCVVRSS